MGKKAHDDGVCVTMYDVVTFTLLHNAHNTRAHREPNSIKRPMKMYHRKICVPCHRKTCICVVYIHITTKKVPHVIN